MGYYDVSQICLNGHTITRAPRQSPDLTQPFCSRCGEQTVTACQECREPIQGKYHVDGVLSFGVSTPPPPNFCHACGKPYPWTQRRLDAAKDLADELEDLSNEDRERLKQSLDALQRDGPQTEVAAVRLKKIMAKVGKESYSAMKEILMGVLSEAVRKSVFGS